MFSKKQQINEKEIYFTNFFANFFGDNRTFRTDGITFLEYETIYSHIGRHHFISFSNSNCRFRV